MTSPAAVGARQVGVAPGPGWLLRRATALLFVDGADTRADALIEAFCAASDASTIDAVTDAVTAAAFDSVPFALVEWGRELTVVVFGSLDVRTDHPSLPMLSGAGSASWVERRLRAGRDTVAIEAGVPADPGTDLRLGRVTAGGFRVILDPAATGPSSGPDPQPSQAFVAPPDPDPTIPTSAPPPPPADPTGPVSGDRLAALRAAMQVHDDDVPASTASTADDPIDDEVTLEPFVSTREPEPQPAALADEADDGTPFVQAVRCPRDHVNPTHVSVCQTCGDLLEAGAPTATIRQPPLAMLDLPGAEAIAVDRPMVLGRRPDHESAQAPERAQLVVVADDPSISRTHLRIDVEDWALAVTDCGSRSGTAIVVRPGEEPRILEPWVTHELPLGARLFLGGPTSVVVRPIPSPGRSRGGRG